MLQESLVRHIVLNGSGGQLLFIMIVSWCIVISISSDILLLQRLSNIDLVKGIQEALSGLE